MENENKCFFSISLENGITITGENPEIVLNFLARLETATYWAAEHYKDADLLKLQEICEELNQQID